MKTIIAGGRDYRPTRAHADRLNELRAEIPITSVVCGMAVGADTYGRLWAEHHGIPVHQFPADWSAYGRAAGSIRNRRMAEFAEVLVAFPGGRGTANMVKVAWELGLVIYKIGW